MKSKNLGEISDKLLIFGGAYGNLHALKKLKSIADQKGFSPEQVIFTGDTAAYCAHPEETIQLIKEWGIHAIAGNVEIQLREGRDDCGCNFEDSTTCDRLSRRWYPFVQQQISKSSIEWMKGLPGSLMFKTGGRKITVVHGSYTNVSQYIFESTDWSVKQSEFEAADTDIIIGGHCGLPFSDRRDDKRWINAGAIGMPANDKTSRVWYLTMDQNKAEHHAFTYNHIKAQEAMRDLNLPEEYSKTLSTGVWDNCDILPAKETRQQGDPIRLHPVLF